MSIELLYTTILQRLEKRRFALSAEKKAFRLVVNFIEKRRFAFNC